MCPQAQTLSIRSHDGGIKSVGSFCDLNQGDGETTNLLFPSFAAHQEKVLFEMIRAELWAISIMVSAAGELAGGLMTSAFQPVKLAANFPPHVGSSENSQTPAGSGLLRVIFLSASM